MVFSQLSQLNSLMLQKASDELCCLCRAVPFGLPIYVTSAQVSRSQKRDAVRRCTCVLEPRMFKSFGFWYRYNRKFQFQIRVKSCLWTERCFPFKLGISHADSKDNVSCSERLRFHFNVIFLLSYSYRKRNSWYLLEKVVSCWLLKRSVFHC